MSDNIVHDYLAKNGKKGGLIGGKSRSIKKQKASKKNGKLGGRPKKGNCI